MSTKTLRKRIALVAVAALGAGLVSVAPANAAVTANSLVPATVIGAGVSNAAAGSSNATGTAGVLNIATAKSTDGTTNSSAASIGLVNVSDVAGTRIAGTTQTAVLLSTGTISVYTAATSRYTSLITVEGGTIVGTANAGAFSAAGTSVAANNAALKASIKPNAGVTSMTIRMYVTDGYSTGTTSWTAAELLGGDTSGVLTGQIAVTIASASTAGVFSAAKSGVWYSDTAAHATGLTADYSGTTGSVAVGNVQYANVRVRDAFGTAITTAGLLEVSASNGAFVNVAATGTASTPSVSTAYSATLADDAAITVSAPSTAPVTTVVTVKYNGTVVGTKSFTFTGNVAKVILSAPVNGKISGSANTATIAYADAAGNAVYMTGNTPAGNFLQDSSTFGGIVTAISQSTAPSNSTTPGVISFTCGAVAGKASIGVTYTNNDGTIIKSNALPVTCSGAAVTYTASYDKSSYKPGEIATLNVTFKDSLGNIANDIDATNTSAPVISESGLTHVGTGPSTTEVISNGVVSYKYIVGNTEGAFTNSISFPTVNTRATNASIVQGAITATANVAGSGAVTNADVLKAIVSLIASINKQIAALQKALLKK